MRSVNRSIVIISMTISFLLGGLVSCQTLSNSRTGIGIYVYDSATNLPLEGVRIKGASAQNDQLVVGDKTSDKNGSVIFYNEGAQFPEDVLLLCSKSGFVDQVIHVTNKDYVGDVANIKIYMISISP